MLSPLFWLSLVAVFWGLKHIAEGLMSLAEVNVRALPRDQTTPAMVVSPSAWRDPRPETSLDEAA